jgi:2,6-dihydroxypseudooxynicotine hydrolase
MRDSDIQSAIDHWAPRFITQGVDANDFARVTNSLETWSQWLDAWVANGDMHAGLASEAEVAGHKISAGNAWNRAALSYHFAKFVWVLDMAKHKMATEMSIAALLRAHKNLDSSAERVEIPFEGHHLVGNLRKPAGITHPPVVILLPGLDSTKEEFFNWENVFITRGLATFSFDGPGQGESGFYFPLRPNYESAIKVAIDELLTRTDIDAERLGVVGVSMGGYYAARSAAHDSRIKVAVTVGGSYDTGSRYDARPPISRAAFYQYSGASTEDEARKVADSITLEGCLQNLTQPLLVIFGKKDRLVPYQHAERVVAEAKNAKLVMIDDGNHVCNNYPYLYHPLAGDWMVDHL